MNSAYDPEIHKESKYPQDLTSLGWQMENWTPTEQYAIRKLSLDVLASVLSDDKTTIYNGGVTVIPSNDAEVHPPMIQIHFEYEGIMWVVDLYADRSFQPTPVERIKKL